MFGFNLFKTVWCFGLPTNNSWAGFGAFPDHFWAVLELFWAWASFGGFGAFPDHFWAGLLSFDLSFDRKFLMSTKTSLVPWLFLECLRALVLAFRCCFGALPDHSWALLEACWALPNHLELSWGSPKPFLGCLGPDRLGLVYVWSVRDPAAFGRARTWKQQNCLDENNGQTNLHVRLREYTICIHSCLERLGFRV